MCVRARSCEMRYAPRGCPSPRGSSRPSSYSRRAPSQATRPLRRRRGPLGRLQYIDLSRHGYVLFHCFFPNGLRLVRECGLVPRLSVADPRDHATRVSATPWSRSPSSWAFDIGAVMLIWAGFYRRDHFCRRGRSSAVRGLRARADLRLRRLPALDARVLHRALPLASRPGAMAPRRASRARRCAHLPGGIAAPVATAFALLFVYQRVSLLTRARRIALAVLPPVIALGIFAYVQERETKHWDAYFLGQANFRHDFTDPFSTGFPRAAPPRSTWKLFTLSNAPLAQTLMSPSRCRDTLVLGWRLAGPVFGRPAIRPFHVAGRPLDDRRLVDPPGNDRSLPVPGEAALLPAAILVGTLPRLLAGADRRSRYRRSASRWRCCSSGIRSSDELVARDGCSTGRGYPLRPIVVPPVPNWGLAGGQTITSPSSGDQPAEAWYR